MAYWLDRKTTPTALVDLRGELNSLGEVSERIRHAIAKHDAVSAIDALEAAVDAWFNAMHWLPHLRRLDVTERYAAIVDMLSRCRALIQLIEHVSAKIEGCAGLRGVCALLREHCDGLGTAAAEDEHALRNGSTPDSEDSDLS